MHSVGWKLAQPFGVPAQQSAAAPIEVQLYLAGLALRFAHELQYTHQRNHECILAVAAPQRHDR